MWKGLALLAANEVGGTVKRNLTAIAFYAAAGVVALMAFGYGLAALHGWIMAYMTPIEASLVMAGGLLILAFLIAMIGLSYKRKRNPPMQASTAALVVMPLAARIVGGRVNLATVVMGSMLVAGAVLGRQLTK